MAKYVVQVHMESVRQVEVEVPGSEDLRDIERAAVEQARKEFGDADRVYVAYYSALDDTHQKCLEATDA